VTTALITGASSGIGEAIARELAAQQHDLILVARRESSLRALADELTAAHGISAEITVADLAAPGAGTRLAETLDGREVDVLVNNAGFGDFGEFADADPKKIDEMLQLNVATLTELTRQIVPTMVARGSGQIMNVASTAAFMPGPLMAVYYATKAYVLSFGEALANELHGTGVTVTTLCPGPIATGFQAASDLEESKLVKGKKLMTATTCARAAVKGMQRGTTVVIPGWKNKLQASAPRFLPRRMVPGSVRRAQAPAS
jgi:uncharacterized protein